MNGNGCSFCVCFVVCEFEMVNVVRLSWRIGNRVIYENIKVFLNVIYKVVGFKGGIVFFF